MRSAGSGNKPGRVQWVDYAKGFCIIFVIMMHSTLGVEKAAGDTGWMHYLVQFAKPFRMPDFFLISGLFLGLVISRPWLRYIDRKVVHFAYFYVLWMTIQFVTKTPQWLGEGQSLMDVAQFWAMSLIEPFGTLWFIYMLPVFFIVTRLIKSVPWYLTLGVAALLEILPIHTGWLLVDEFTSRYVYFFAGYLFAENIFRLADWAKENVKIAVAGLLVWAVINGLYTFVAVPDAVSIWLGLEPGKYYLSDLPFISLALGAAGAVAII
ncbi:MAG: acyltransferase family protein, partial [Rhizobiaceae bacterium]